MNCGLCQNYVLIANPLTCCTRNDSLHIWYTCTFEFLAIPLLLVPLHTLLPGGAPEYSKGRILGRVAILFSNGSEHDSVKSKLLLLLAPLEPSTVAPTVDVPESRLMFFNFKDIFSELSRGSLGTDELRFISLSLSMDARCFKGAEIDDGGASCCICLLLLLLFSSVMAIVPPPAAPLGLDLPLESLSFLKFGNDTLCSFAVNSLLCRPGVLRPKCAPVGICWPSMAS